VADTDNIRTLFLCDTTEKESIYLDMLKNLSTPGRTKVFKQCYEPFLSATLLKLREVWNFHGSDHEN
jgi:hypothetical protein